MRVLIAIDGSSNSRDAVRYLETLNIPSVQGVDLVTVVSPPFAIDTLPLGIPPELGEFMDQETEAARSELKTVAENIGKYDTNLDVLVGPVTTEIVRQAKEKQTDLVVVGAVGHTSLERVLLGSVSDYVATHADCSVLIVRPSYPSEHIGAPKKILATLAGNESDQEIIDWLIQMDLPKTVEVHLVRLIPLNKYFGTDIREKASEYWDAKVREANAQVLAVENQLQSAGITTESHLREATHIGKSLLEYASSHDIDLILAGDSHSHFARRLILGSVSRFILRHAECNVLIVRPKAQS